MASIDDKDVVDISESAQATPGQLFRETDTVLIVRTDANGNATGETDLSSIADLRKNLTAADLFSDVVPVAPGKPNQKTWRTRASEGQVDVYQWDGTAWQKSITGLVLSTTAAPAGPSPVVTLLAVAPGVVGVQLTLNATASETNGTIAKVEFFDGAVKVGEATSTPYSTSYVPTAAGHHYFTAKATDAAGRSTVSAPRDVLIAGVPIHLNQAPAVSLSLAPATLTLGQATTLSALASDSDGTVSKVEFFDGTTKIGEVTTSPYVLSYTPSATGTAVLSAKATDDQGASSIATKQLVVNAVGTTVTKPGAPTGLVAVATIASNTPNITISGVAPTNSGGAIISDYNVYRDGGSTPIGSFPAPTGTALTYTDSAVVNGAAHTYEFTAINTKGESVRSVPSNSATPTAPTGTPPTFNTTLTPVFDSNSGSYFDNKSTLYWLTSASVALLKTDFPLSSNPDPSPAFMIVQAPDGLVIGKLDYQGWDNGHQFAIVYQGLTYYNNAAGGVLIFTAGATITIA